MRYKKNKGFTLIELMIVVAVVAILAAVAYPSYQDSVQKTRRADAKAALERAAGLQERFFTENNSYAFPADIGKVGGASSTEGYYTITLANTDLAGTSCVSGGYAPCFLFTATATGVQTKDTDCDKFTLDEKGVRAAKTKGGAVNAACW